MCSTPAQRIAEIGQAIDDLAAQANAVYPPTGAERPAISDADQVVIRLAEIWTLLADLDPEMARRLARYQA